MIVYLLPKTSRNLVGSSLGDFWRNFGIGFLTLVAAPAVMIILAVTVIGLKLAGILLFAYVTYLVVAGLFGSLSIGAQILKWIEKKDYRVDWLTVLVGTVAAIIIGVIPVLGGLVIFAFTMAVLGSIVTGTTNFLKSQR